MTTLGIYAIMHNEGLPHQVAGIPHDDTITQNSLLFTFGEFITLNKMMYTQFKKDLNNLRGYY